MYDFCLEILFIVFPIELFYSLMTIIIGAIICFIYCYQIKRNFMTDLKRIVISVFVTIFFTVFSRIFFGNMRSHRMFEKRGNIYSLWRRYFHPILFFFLCISEFVCGLISIACMYVFIYLYLLLFFHL